jgi:cytoskeletal protein CcmA (bactofilin family)
MWKPNQPGSQTPPTPEPARPQAPAGTPAFDASRAGSSATATGEQATIGKSLVVKGELSGSESLYVDGKVEGAINLPGNRVTVRGNCQASDRVDIRSEGSLTGDVVAARISIEDGAFFKGGIDIRKPGNEAKGGSAPAASTSTSSTPEPAAATSHS